jgi:L-2-hydroxyglutarate oxidase LhgO
MGTALNGSSNLDIGSELRLVEEAKKELQLSETDSLKSTEKLERTTMKELGIKRLVLFLQEMIRQFIKGKGSFNNGYFDNKFAK